MIDNPAKRAPMTDEDIITLVTPMMDRAKTEAERLSRERAEGYKWYRAEPYGNEREGHSQTVHPTIYSVVEWMKPGLNEVFTGDFFSFSPSGPGDKEAGKASAERLKKYVRYKMFAESDGEQLSEDIIHDALTSNFAVVKVTQREDYDVVTERVGPSPLAMLEQAFQADQNITKIVPDSIEPVQNPATEEMVDFVTGGTVFKRVPKYVGPSVEIIPPEEFRYTPGRRALDACPLVAHVVRRDMDHILRQELAGVYRKGSSEAVREKAEEGTQDTVVKLAQSERDGFDTHTIIDASGDYDHGPVLTATESNKEYEVWECYLRLDLDGSGLLQPAIVTVCGDVILRDPTPNPYGSPPFEMLAVNKEPHTMGGRSIPQILNDRQRVNTNLLRLIQDGGAYSAYQGYLTTDRRAQKALTDMRPGETSLVPSLQAGVIQEVKPSPPGSFLIQAFEMTLQEVSKESGINENMQGLDNNALNKTASGMSMRLTAGMQRQKQVARRMARFYKRVLQRVLDIIRLYPPEDDIPLLGADVEISPEDYQGKYSVEIDVGVGPQDRQMKAAHLGELVAMLLQNGPNLGVLPDRIFAAIKAQFDELDIDISALLPAPGEVQSIQGIMQQLQQMQQQMQQMAGENQQLHQAIQDHAEEMGRGGNHEDAQQDARMASGERQMPPMPPQGPQMMQDMPNG